VRIVVRGRGSVARYLDTRCGFLAECRRREALAARRVGAYDSRRTRVETRVAEAMAMVRSQKTERQPLAAVRKPPPMGPITGPRRGPMLQIDMALPRSRGMNMSATEPPPMVIGVLPTMPASKRKVMSIPMLLE
jgi:hypothetical protein